jgi:excisionase family DNA binding protein
MLPNGHEFLTAQEIASYLRIPLSTIYKLVQDKQIPAFRVGKHYRFRRETILEWVKQQEINSKIQNNGA